MREISRGNEGKRGMEEERERERVEGMGKERSIREVRKSEGEIEGGGEGS